jgi:hypothetical protein
VVDRTINRGNGKGSGGNWICCSGLASQGGGRASQKHFCSAIQGRGVEIEVRVTGWSDINLELRDLTMLSR